MPGANYDNLLDVILDSWDRNNRILVNLLRALPPGGLEARAMSGSPTVAEMFTHMHLSVSSFSPRMLPNAPSRCPSESGSEGEFRPHR